MKNFLLFLMIFSSCNYYQTPKYKLGRRVIGYNEEDSVRSIKNRMRLGETEYSIKFDYIKVKKAFFHRSSFKMKAKGFCIISRGTKYNPDTTIFVWVQKIVRKENKIISSKGLYAPDFELLNENVPPYEREFYKIKPFKFKTRLRDSESILFSGTGHATFELTIEN